MAKAALALAHAEGDRMADMRQLLKEFAASGFDLVFDGSWIIGMCGFAEAAAVLGDVKYATPLFERLSPWAGQWCTTGITCQGPVSHYVGALAAVLGRFAEADVYFSQAESMCSRANAKFFAARTHYSWETCWPRVALSKAGLGICLSRHTRRRRPIVTERSSSALGPHSDRWIDNRWVDILMKMRSTRPIQR